MSIRNAAATVAVAGMLLLSGCATPSQSSTALFENMATIEQDAKREVIAQLIDDAIARADGSVSSEQLSVLDTPRGESYAHASRPQDLRTQVRITPLSR